MPHVFADGADIQAWARSDVYWAYNSGVMNGVSGNRFAPNNSYTHEQSIATMLRLYDTKYAEVPSKTAAKYILLLLTAMTVLMYRCTLRMPRVTSY